MRGFTLIEMMIVAAIVVILLAIANPAYNNYQCEKNGGINCTKKQDRRVVVRDCVVVDSKKYCEDKP